MYWFLLFLLCGFGGLYAAPVKSFAALDADDSNRDFNRAFEKIQAGKESEAFLSFTDFIRRYPQHSKVDAAYYYVGEIYYRRREYLKAFEEFKKSLSYKDQKNVFQEILPESALRLAQCQLSLNRRLEARIELHALIRRYPKSPAASEALELLQGLEGNS